MKIKYKAPDLLIASKTTWFFTTLVFLFAVLFALNGLLLMSAESAISFVIILGGCSMGVIAICMFVERMQLVLDAQTKTVTISARTILSHSWAVFPLDDLLYAAAQSEEDSETSTRDKTCQTISGTSLVLREGTQTAGSIFRPSSGLFASRRLEKHIVCDINGWLQNLRNQEVLPNSA